MLLGLSCAVPMVVFAARSLEPVLLVDRGLPDSSTTALRVGWSANDGLLVTDHFKIGQAGEPWVIDKVRTWASLAVQNGKPSTLGDMFEKVTLYGGLETETPPATTQAAAAECACHGPVPIVAAELRRGSNLSQNPQVQFTRLSDLWQADFRNLRWNVPGGTSVQFGISGVGRAIQGQAQKPVWWSHASATSGTHQFRLFETGGSPVVVPANSELPSDNSVGINVQVWGHRTAYVTVYPQGKDWQVVLQGDARFDVLRVKLESLGFGPNATPPIAHRMEDFDHDGHADLVLRINSSSAGIPPNQSIGCLSGLSGESVPFEGCGVLSKP